MTEEIHPISIEEFNQLLLQLESLDNVADIEILQKKLQQDYKLLSKSFANVRIKRVDSYIKKIDEIQSKLRKNFNSYYSIIESNPSNENSKKKDLPEVPISPSLTNIPIFPQVFNSIIDNFQNDLNVLTSKYNYEAKLIENSSRNETEIIWQHFQQDKIKFKQEKRKQLNDMKYELSNDYYNLTKFSKQSKLEKRYRISVRRVTEKKDRSVFNFAKNSVLKKYKSPKIIDSDSLLPHLSSIEIDKDLKILKENNLNSIKINREEANYKYLEKPIQKAKVVIDSIRPTMTDLVNLQLENGGNIIPVEVPLTNEGSRDRIQQNRKFHQQQLKQPRIQSNIQQDFDFRFQQPHQHQNFYNPLSNELRRPYPTHLNPLDYQLQQQQQQLQQQFYFENEEKKKDYGRIQPPHGQGQFQLFRFAR